MNEIKSNYIYLLHEREFIRTNENIYKVGMSRQSNLSRFNNYPKGSQLICQIECIDCKFVETVILRLFSDKFHKCNEYGNEYFQGDKKCMIDIIYIIISFENEIQQQNITHRSEYIESILANHVQKYNLLNNKTEHSSIETQNTNTKMNTNTSSNNTTPDENNVLYAMSKDTYAVLLSYFQSMNNILLNSFNKQESLPKYKFYCKMCNFFTNKSCNYIEHITTKKHKYNRDNSNNCIHTPVTVEGDETTSTEIQEQRKTYPCNICNKSYYSKKGLWQHSKKCNITTTTKLAQTNSSTEKPSDVVAMATIMSEMSKEMFKSNQSFMIQAINNKLTESGIDLHF